MRRERTTAPFSEKALVKISRTLGLCNAHFCSAGEFHVFDPPVPGSARVSTPTLRQLNDTEAASRKFTLDFTGTPGISKRLGQKGSNKDQLG